MRSRLGETAWRGTNGRRAEQHGLAGGKGARLEDRVAVALLLVLDGEREPFAEFPHVQGLGVEARIFLEAAQIGIIRSVEVGADRRVVAGLHDHANLLDARADEFKQVIVNHRTGDAVGRDDGKQLLLTACEAGNKRVPSPRRGHGFADGHLGKS